ncbi:hypothetical protein SDC9_103188 [bioreactor metagenome]|uniref:RNA-binding S4 domain-containing protein n=1 Tax=bioreactor metagenome TaxID=1076179 RepID=A0A645AU24_9ZZZZ|nr:YlmH/Sll1252 family protein [Erysipelotrichaceae bacterium]
MLTNDKSSRSGHLPQNGQLLKRVDDLIKQWEKYQQPRYSFFLKPNEILSIQQYLGTKYPYHFDGGYSEAQLKRLIVGETADNRISCLTYQSDSKYIVLTHRDVLGALMNLGIEREQFGDMWIEDGRIVLYAISDIADYIIDNLIQINKLKVKLTIADAVFEHQEKIRVFQKTITGFRLDNIVQTITGSSRTKAQQMIRQQVVAVNYEVLEENDHLCNNGDTISVRGFGRYVIMEVVKITKKERLLLKFGKYE